MWSLLFDIALKANFYAKFEIKDCDLYFLLFIRNRQCANQTNFLFPIFQQVPSSSIAKGEKKWCTWKRMDPCLCIMSARIRMKHVWTWQDLSKGFSSQVGTLLCVGTAVVIPVPAPALRGPHLCCRGGSQSSWTATVYNLTSSSGTLLVSPTLQCHQRHSPSFVSDLQLMNIPLTLPADTAIPVTPDDYLMLGGPPVRSSMRNFAEISWSNSL